MSVNSTLKQGLLFFILLAFLVASPLTHAQWVQATGRSVIENNQIAPAREAARKDALREAAMKYGATVDSNDFMANGRIVSTSLNVHTRAYARKVKVTHEAQNGNVITMQISADMVEAQRCPVNKANGYRKKISVVGFSLQKPSQAALGGLYDIERTLPSYLVDRLNRYQNLRVFETSHLRLYDELTNAPTSFSQRKTITKAVKLAAKMGAQFVVSGVVRDLSVQSPSAFRQSRLLSAARFWGGVDKTRLAY